MWFKGQKHCSFVETDSTTIHNNIKLFTEVKHWLDSYFAGNIPQTEIAVAPSGTAFQKEVWQQLQTIPYGETISYGTLATRVAAHRGNSNKKVSARAVGGAVGRNPISIILPCHRVIGANGNLTGYAGGLERKRYLLSLEQQP